MNPEIGAVLEGRVEGRPVVWEVWSPEYVTYGQTETDPEEIGRDVLVVFCRGGAGRAKALAVRGWRRLQGRWRYIFDEDGHYSHPGLEASRPRLAPAWDENCPRCKAVA